jgi:LPXTG-site transpeptidase (sortase) family protein
MGVPARLLIPAIGVDAPVDAVGVDANGDMAVPGQVRRIGWYRFGAKPGSPAGSVVMSGHVDSAQQGLGAFSALGKLKAGDVLTVADAAGRQLRYRVVGREAFAKKSAPLAELFSTSGAARLTLITCGGSFDRSALSYNDNIVVTAVPG